MTDIVIRVENLSKLYNIGQARSPYGSLRESLAQAVAEPFRRLKKGTSGRQEGGSDSIWALKDVSLEVKRSEVVGVIGRNGAGKSTLLKILSRITKPTSGSAVVRGRVGSLLEVGTGFHPELTGRENIYLNGAVLGMQRAEIERKFDEIVAFAEIEKFLDTPVKRYSSGMYVRLAFAVAAHLEPEILFIDEVLAVGDAEFQRKCLGKMGDVAREGRTVMFVSHNMAAIENLCERAVFIDEGEIRADKKTDIAIEEYLNSFTDTTFGVDLAFVKRQRGLTPVIEKLEIFDRKGLQVTAVPVRSAISIRIHYRHIEEIKDASFGLVFETYKGIKVFHVQARFQRGVFKRLPTSGVVICNIPQIPLIPGTYFITPGCTTGAHQLDLVPRAFEFQVTESDIFGTGHLPPQSAGLVLVDAEWEVNVEVTENQ